jgi:regulator of microtubule dynamics protein 3
MKILSFIFVFLFLRLSDGVAQTTAAALLVQADSLYARFDNAAALKVYLQICALDSNQYEASWKASRTYSDLGETMEGDLRAEYFNLSEVYARRAVRIDSTGAKGHLQLSIALGRVALDASPKRRIQLSKEIKKEVDLAIQYDPADDYAHHVLGRWHRKLANLSWVEKTFANVFLGGVPKEASNEGAAACFQKAIDLNPTHINHYLELGLTYELMGDKEKARAAFQKCLDLPKSDSDDDTYKQQAEQKLKEL